MRFFFGGFSVLVMTAQLASAQNQCSEVGLTWTTLGQHAETGATHVGVDTLSNPYQGDTACTEKRPVLCINTTVGFERPHHLNVPEAPVPASGSIPGALRLSPQQTSTLGPRAQLQRHLLLPDAIWKPLQKRTICAASCSGTTGALQNITTALVMAFGHMEPQAAVTAVFGLTSMISQMEHAGPNRSRGLRSIDGF